MLIIDTLFVNKEIFIVMDKDILKIVNKVLSEEVSGKLSKIKSRIFENKSMVLKCCAITLCLLLSTA